MLGAACLSGCGYECENAIKSKAVSPSGNKVAFVFHRECMAITGISTEVSVVSSAASQPDYGGNVFSADGLAPIVVHWDSETKLSIDGVSSTQIFKREASIAGVAIVYTD
jgi:hypothetical protein